MATPVDDGFLRWIYESCIVEIQFKPYRGMDSSGGPEPVTFSSEDGEERTVDARRLRRSNLDAVLEFYPDYRGLVGHEHRIRKQVEARREHADLLEERDQLNARLVEIKKVLDGEEMKDG